MCIRIVMYSAPNDSECFTRFVTGLCSGIGELRKDDAEISVALMIKMKRLLELERQLEVKKNDKEHIRTAADNISLQNFTYCGSLRGYETPKVLPHNIHHHISLQKN